MKRLVFWQLFVAALLLTSNSHAQSIKDLFNKENIEKAVNAVTGKSTADMTGTWSYTGSAIEFESDNLLQKAGGAVAATAAEKKLDEQLAKVGIKAGQMSFTFNADSTFSAKVGQKSMKGSYSYDASTQKVNLKFAKLIGMNAKVNATSTTMDLLFESDKLLKLITFLSSKSSNSTLKSIGSDSHYRNCNNNFHTTKKSRKHRTMLAGFFYLKRAENETRTRDPNLGKVMLYQLSYFRMG